MRTIKFRAWDKKNKEMLVPVGVYEDGVPFIRYNEGISALPLYDYPLMQYTGLKDKNGKEIYEGDIVKIKEESPVSNEDLSSEAIVKITWNDEKAGFSLDWYSNDLTVYQDLEVIGNVWENPELLK